MWVDVAAMVLGFWGGTALWWWRHDRAHDASLRASRAITFLPRMLADILRSE